MRRILVVDDAPMNQLVARRALERLGYQPVVADRHLDDGEAHAAHAQCGQRPFLFSPAYSPPAAPPAAPAAWTPPRAPLRAPACHPARPEILAAATIPPPSTR